MHFHVHQWQQREENMLSIELMGFCLSVSTNASALGELFLHAGPSELVTLSWLSPESCGLAGPGVGGRRVANLGLLSRTLAQSRIEEIFQLTTYRCSLRECLGSFTQFNLRHK